jgi:hypothetical protein
MPAPTSGPHPADRDAISEAVDDMEERVVGRRVDPPKSGDLGEEAGGDEAGDEGGAPDDSGRGTVPEPS